MADESRNANVVLTANVDPYSQGMQQATKQTNTLTESINKLVASMDGITKRVGKKLLIFSAADAAAMTAYVAIAAKHEKQLTTIRAQTELTNKSYGNFKKGIDEVARALPISGDAVIALTTQISKLGVTSERQALSMARTFTKLSAATGEDLGTLTAGLIELSRQMGTLGNGAEGIGKFADSLTTVSSQAGVSATAVLQFSQAIAPMARAAGIGQKEVLGISTAFTKAGADGFAAANAFSTMVTEIARATMSGSPAIGKYAETIGATVEQFNAMDSTERVVRLFEAVNKAGPDSVKILDRLGIDGIRAAKAIQSVAAESGGLRKAIQDSMGAYGNGSTDKGAAAAFDSLDAQTTKLKNNMEQIASAIGDGILPVAKAFMAVMNGVLDAVNRVAGPLLTVAGAIGGLLAPVAASVGLLMSALGPLSSIMIAMTLFRLSPMRAAFQGFKEGSYAAGASRMGASYSPVTQAGRMMAPGGGGMPIYQRAPYLAAQRIGGMVPTMTGPSPLGQLALRGGIGTANAFTNWYAMPTQQLIANAGMRDSFGRVSYMGNALDSVYNKSATVRGAMGQAFTNPIAYMAAMRASRAGGGVAPSLANAANIARTGGYDHGMAKAEASARAENVMRTDRSGDYAKTLDKANAEYKSTMDAHKDAAKAARDVSAANKLQVRTTGDLGKALANAAKSAAGIGVAYGKMGASLLAQSAATAGKSIFGMLGGMVGMGAGAGAAIAGVAAVGLGWQKARESTQSTFDPTRARNITNTNEALGVATEPVKDFASAINEAAGATRSLKTALLGMTLTAGEVLAAQTREPVDKTFKDLRSPEQAVAYIKSMSDLSGEQARSLAQDAVSQFGPALGEQIRRQVMQQTGNLSTMGGNDVQGILMKGAGETQNDTWLGGVSKGLSNSVPFFGAWTQSGAGSALFGGSPWMDEGAKNQVNAGVGAMWSEWSDNTKNFDKEVGSQTLATRMMEASDQIFSDNSKSGKMVQDTFIKAIEKNMLGGKELGIGMNLVTGQATMNNNNINGGADLLQQVMAGEGEGAKILANLLGDANISSTPKAEGKLTQMLNGEIITPAERMIRRTSLGSFSRENEAIKAATEGDKMGSPEDISKAVKAMTDELTKGGTDFSMAAEEVNKLKNNITNTESPLYQLTTAAGAAAKELGMIQASRMGGSIGALDTEIKDIDTQLTTGDYRTGEDQTSLEKRRAEKLLQRDQLALVFAQTTESMNIGTDRMLADYQLSAQNSWDDFQRQMGYSIDDFGRQMERSAEQAAKSMYDPFRRVTNPGSASTGAIVGNLKEQAQMLQEQVANIAKAKKMGLKQSTIDQLDLTNPNQAFQLENIVETGGQDIGALNKAAGKVASGAKGLQAQQQGTRWSVEDQNRQIRRQEKEREIQIERQIKLNQKTIDRMTEDWAKYGKDIVGDTKDVYVRMEEATKTALDNASAAVRRRVKADTEFMGNRLAALRAAAGDNTDAPPAPQKPSGGPGDFNRDRTKWEDPALHRQSHADAGRKVGYQNAWEDNGKWYVQTGGSKANKPFEIKGVPWGKWMAEGDVAAMSQWWTENIAVPGYSAGGVVTHKQLAMLGEKAAMEVVIPLSGGDGHRAMGVLAHQITKEMTKAYRVSGHASAVAYKGGGSTVITTTNNFQVAKVVAHDVNDMARQLKERARLENMRRGANVAV